MNPPQDNAEMVGVAQLVEHWIVIPVVAGSIPVTHPKTPRFARGFFCARMPTPRWRSFEAPQQASRRRRGKFDGK